jgi:Ser/Thr protein kinase RdoA (MazF antagonist)
MADAMGSPGKEVEEAVASWSRLRGARLEPIEGGLINRTWRARAREGEFIVQSIHPDFSTGVHQNIQAISDHLAPQGVSVARLLETDGGDLFADLGARGRWRVMERIPGASFTRCRGPAQARAAGALVAGFHRGMMDWEGDLAPIGFPFHDLPQHLSDLRRALGEHVGHPLHSEVRRLAETLFEIHESWPLPPPLPLRVVHGDLKLSNLLFAGSESPGADRAVALIDLDTISRLPIYYDMGDAWRSWCNLGGDGPEEVRLDLEIFHASAEGYLSGVGSELSEQELESLVHALERISVELCARFAADVLEERHFSWNAELFPSAAEHNLYRARGQLGLHYQARETRDERARLLLG